MDEKKYYTDIIAGLTERTIKRLWIIIILLIVLLVGTNCAWIYYESQFEDATITQDVLQEVSGEQSRNYFAGGDMYGSTAESTNDSQTAG